MKRLSLLSISGKKLLSIENIDINKYDLDVSSIPSGVYLLEVDISGITQTKKLIIME